MNHLLCTMDNLGGVPENDGVGAITWGVRSLQRAGSHAYWEESFWKIQTQSVHKKSRLKLTSKHTTEPPLALANT